MTAIIFKLLSSVKSSMLRDEREHGVVCLLYMGFIQGRYNGDHTGVSGH